MSEMSETEQSVTLDRQELRRTIIRCRPDKSSVWTEYVFAKSQDAAQFWNDYLAMHWVAGQAHMKDFISRQTGQSGSHDPLWREPQSTPVVAPQGDALDRIQKAVDDASEERYQSLKEWDRLADRWQSEGDMYGWNFHKGMVAGANYVDIYYHRVTREITAIRNAAPVTAPVSTGEQPPRCVKCGHDAGIERTLKRCKARIDGGEALCQCHCVFPAATSTTPDGERDTLPPTPLEIDLAVQRGRNAGYYIFDAAGNKVGEVYGRAFGRWLAARIAATPPPAVTEPGEQLWTAEPPKVDGVYWWRLSENDPDPDICETDLQYGTVYDIGEPQGESIAGRGGEWLGPVVPEAPVIAPVIDRTPRFEVSPPSTSAAIRAAAREWMNTWHGAFATNKEREDALVAILSRYFGKGETDKPFVNEFTEATIEAHVGYHHEKTFHDCDYVVCAKRREMIDALNAAPSSPSPGEPRDAASDSELTDLQRAVIEHDDDMARLDRNTLPEKINEHN